MKKIPIKDLSQAALIELAEKYDEKAFRGKQLYHWLFVKNAGSFEDMQNLPKSFREKLAENAIMDLLQHEKTSESPSGDAKKFLFRLHDGELIETVLMFYEDRRTICISTQIGCPVDCQFCATGLMGLKRNLTPGEILEQFFQVEKLSGEAITNIVVMGMGEPMLNYDALMHALEIISDENGRDFARSHIVISTSGILPRIEQFISEKRPYRLALSLNATTDAVRDDLMPLNKKWPIQKLLEAAHRYTEALKRRITIEYVLLKDVNDFIDDARRLRSMLNGLNCVLNIIPYNTTYSIYRRPEKETIERFYREFQGVYYPVTIRWSKGTDIDAACGQLVTRQKDEALRNEQKRRAAIEMGG